MAKYVKDKPRIDVQFIDSVSDEVLIEIKNRNWMNVGELFVDNCADSIMKSEKIPLPKKLMVIAVAEYTLVDD